MVLRRVECRPSTSFAHSMARVRAGVTRSPAAAAYCWRESIIGATGRVSCTRVPPGQQGAEFVQHLRTPQLERREVGANQPLAHQPPVDMVDDARADVALCCDARRLSLRQRPRGLARHRDHEVFEATTRHRSPRAVTRERRAQHRARP